ncbi:MAG: hypothetical protein COB33_004040 [Thiotrichaceae bacterium]|nr:hypothetical protein [Thiotrichaceae bacterium]
MPNTEEQRLDIIENCNILLNGILKSFNNTDSQAFDLCVKSHGSDWT